MACSEGDNHCCWFNGEVCRYLEENSGGRRWSCSLLKELGDWEMVYADPRYIENIIPLYLAIDIGITRCSDWPPTGVVCNDCGEHK